MTDQPAPTLTDRIDLALRTTPCAGHTHKPGMEKWDHHPRPGEKGHTYTYTCALCRNDIEALTTALTAVFQTELEAEIERIRAAVTEGKYRDLGRPLTVSDVRVAHEVTRKALAHALDAGLHLNWPQLVDHAQRSHEANTAWMADVERVRRLHSRGKTTGCCNECGMVSPCTTIQALDGKESTT